LLSKGKLGTAIGYLRNHGDALKRFLSDGRLPIDNNDAERDLRRIAVGRKNWQFGRSRDGGDRAAVLLQVSDSAHRHAWACRRDVLERLAQGESDPEQWLAAPWKAAPRHHLRTLREEGRDQRAEHRRYRAAKRRLEAFTA